MRDSFKAMYLDNLNRGLRYPGGRIKFTSPAVQPALINHTREFNYAVHHAVRLAPVREKSIISGAVPPQLCDSVKRFASYINAGVHARGGRASETLLDYSRDWFTASGEPCDPDANPMTFLVPL